jgi:Na+/melibiose symporter-like transporter
MKAAGHDPSGAPAAAPAGGAMSSSAALAGGAAAGTTVSIDTALPPRPASRPLASLLAYGAPAAPLAFVALPLYVQWPAHHAATQGVALATLGAMLLAVRLADAFIDPWIGRHADRWLGARASSSAVDSPAWRAGAVAVAVVAVGFVALFFPPAGLEGWAGLAWATAALALTSIAFSVAQVLHQAWGARLRGDATAQARIVGAREGQALLGVLAASALPALAGFGWTATVLAAWLAAAWWALGRGPRPTPVAGPGGPDAIASAALRAPLHHRAFRRLLGLHAINGLASAVPATLVLFYVRDRLQQPDAEAALLVLYFLGAALAVPLWVRAVARWGLAASWAAGMVLSVAAFAWAAALGPGDLWAFALVCAASGAALGADLTVPPALVAGLVSRDTSGDLREGACFGWWNLVAKASLALAAGVALPLVQVLGYQPGARDAQGLAALALVYAGLPCLLKLVALGLLWRGRALWAPPPDAAGDAAPHVSPPPSPGLAPMTAPGAPPSWS